MLVGDDDHGTNFRQRTRRAGRAAGLFEINAHLVIEMGIAERCRRSSQLLGRRRHCRRRHEQVVKLIVCGGVLAERLHVYVHINYEISCKQMRDRGCATWGGGIIVLRFVVVWYLLCGIIAFSGEMYSYLFDWKTWASVWRLLSQHECTIWNHSGSG